MANYIYTTDLFKPTGGVVGAPDDTVNLTDFSNNYKSSAIQINDLTIQETSFAIEKSYTDFKNLITSPYDWGDVKYIETPRVCSLYLVTSEAL
jgi:hypothetical protein